MAIAATAPRPAVMLFDGPEINAAAVGTTRDYKSAINNTRVFIRRILIKKAGRLLPGEFCQQGRSGRTNGVKCLRRNTGIPAGAAGAFEPHAQTRMSVSLRTQSPRQPQRAPPWARSLKNAVAEP